MIFQDLEHG